VHAGAGRVDIDYPRQAVRGRPAEIVLNPSVPWSIAIDGGSSDLTADLSDVDLRAFDIRGGASKIDLRLGTPARECRIFVGNTNKLRIRRPARVGVRVEVGGGVSRLELDGETFSGATGLVTESAGSPAETGRYLLAIKSGSNITVTRDR
jgi:hypothetical protein